MIGDATATPSAAHQSFLSYGRFRYLKLGLGVAALTSLWYALDRPVGGANGGSWLGYITGSAGLGLIAWLAWFGVRKRSYRRGIASLSGWLSAHAYLGLALTLVVSLHTGFHFGWNIHSLAYALMILVIASGLFGTYVYWRYPARAAANARGQTASAMVRMVVEIDEECRTHLANASDILSRIVLSALRAEQKPQPLWRAALRPLFYRRRPSPTELAVADLRRLLTARSKDLGPRVHEVLPLLIKRADLVERLERDMHYAAMLQIWRCVHVPATCALLVALTAHVVAVFYY